jgi:hypothetical protein
VDFTIFRTLITAIFLGTFSFTVYAQPCPGFDSGNPANNQYTVSFYNGGGQFITNCDCQLTGNGFKCGNCLPSGFSTYQYVSNGVLLSCANAVVLPVELTAFTATVSNGDVQLSWTTETERDNEEFIIERSEDAVDYVSFAKVSGAGNSITPLHYSLSDTDPLRGISYYRISQRDINGTVTQLAIVSVELSSAVSGTVIAPNPSQGMTVLQLPLHTGEVVFDVVISDELGKVIRTLQLTENTNLELPTGVYRVVVRVDSQTWSEKLIIMD